MITLLSFLVAIAVLVAVHEWGHFSMARACGIKVLRFSIGFGPRIAGWTSMHTGTEYVIALLPFGGYVKMLDEREGTVDKAERLQAFNVQPLAKRAAVVAAGPLANLLLAVLLYTLVNWYGVEQAQPIASRPIAGSVAAKAGFAGEERIHAVALGADSPERVDSFDDFRWWLTRAALANTDLTVIYSKADAQPVRAVLSFAGLDSSIADARLFRAIGFSGPYSAARLRELTPTGAAQIAGLRSGDVVLSVDQVTIVDSSQLRELIRASGKSGTATPQTWKIKRDRVNLEISVLPKLEVDGTLWVGKVGAIIGAPPALVVVRYGAIDGVQRAIGRTWEVSTMTLRMMGQILTGAASLKNLSGPLTIADYAGKSAAMGVTQFAVFLALISISLGILNLLPLPVLDGGHLMYYLWELLTGRPVSDTWIEKLQKVGFVMLMLMMSIAVFNDIARLLG